MASQLVGEKREGSATVTKGDGMTLKFKETYKFLVLTDSKYVSREEVLLDTPGLPIVGLTSISNNLVCTSKSAERNGTNPLYWDVTCEFESQEEDQKQDPNNPSDNPATWIPIFKVDSFETKERVIFTDFSTPVQRICNSAGQPFDQPLTKKLTFCVVSFTQFEDGGVDIQTIMDRNMKINDARFYFGNSASGAAARTLLCQVTSAELGYYNRYRCWRVGYKITYDPETHLERILDVGSSYVDPADNKLKPYMDEQNQFRIVGFLKSDGDKLPRNSATNATTRDFQTYDDIDFDSFIRT
jgi:hypothetical protein